MKRTRTSMVITALVVIGVVLTGGVAGARAGHFRVASTDGTLTTTTTTTTTFTALSSSTDLVVSPTVFVNVKFLENGLGGAKSIDYRLDFTSLAANLVCVNNGTNQPNGVPLSFSGGAASSSQTAPVTVKGTVDATETGLFWNLVDVAAASFGFSCPTGQTVEASYIRVDPVMTIVDTVNNASATVTGNYPLVWGTP